MTANRYSWLLLIALLNSGSLVQSAEPSAASGQQKQQSAEKSQPPASAKPKQPDPVAEIAAKLEPTKRIVYKQVKGQELSLHVFKQGKHMNS